MTRNKLPRTPVYRVKAVELAFHWELNSPLVKECPGVLITILHSKTQPPGNTMESEAFQMKFPTQPKCASSHKSFGYLFLKVRKKYTSKSWRFR